MNRVPRRLKLVACGRRAERLTDEQKAKAWIHLCERLKEFHEFHRPTFSDLLWCIRDSTMLARIVVKPLEKYEP